MVQKLWYFLLYWCKYYSELWHCGNHNLTAESPQISTRGPQTPDKGIGTPCHKCHTQEILDGSHLSGQTCVIKVNSLKNYFFFYKVKYLLQSIRLLIGPQGRLYSPAASEAAHCRPDGRPTCGVWPKSSLICGTQVTRGKMDGGVGYMVQKKKKEIKGPPHFLGKFFF